MTIAFPGPAVWDYFRARHIATGVDGAICVEQDEAGQAARARLARGRFDQAPVVSEPGRVVGWVVAHQLRDNSAVSHVMTSLAESAMVSLEAPIGNVLELLGQQSLVFTVGGNGLSGFIVHSDLDRQPARTHFYLLVAGVEILLSDIIRSVYPVSSVVEAMNAGMAKQYESARKANNDTHPVEYLYLTTLVKLFLEVPAVEDGHSLNEKSINWLQNLNKFRRLVMHPACSIAAARSSGEIAEFTRVAHEVIGRLQVLSEGLRGSGAGGSTV